MKTPAFWTIFKMFIFFLCIIILSYFATKYGDDKNANIVTAAGELWGLFLIIHFCLMFISRCREYAFNTLKIFISASFVMYSGLFYIDTKQRELYISTTKELAAFEYQLASSDFKNISKDDIEFIVDTNRDELCKNVTEYNNLLIKYKHIIGRSMAGLVLGLLAYGVCVGFKHRKQ